MVRDRLTEVSLLKPYLSRMASGQEFATNSPWGIWRIWETMSVEPGARPNPAAMESPRMTSDFP